MKSLGSGSFMKLSQVNKNYIGHGKSCFLLKSGTVAQEYREDTGEILGKVSRARKPRVLVSNMKPSNVNEFKTYFNSCSLLKTMNILLFRK